MSSNSEKPSIKSPPANIWLVLLLIVLSAVVAWQLWKENAGPANAGGRPYEPREVTPTPQPSVSEQNVIHIFENTSPSVVSVRTKGFRELMIGRQSKNLSSGTGFVWDDQGHVVTNLHVIQATLQARNTTLEVQCPGRGTYDAEVGGGDRDNDIAILRLTDVPADLLKPVRLGRSGDLKVGQSVYAIGNPFDFDQTLSTGVIGGLNRVVGRENDQGSLIGLIQTDAAINPGNSGGPLLDSAGRVIGVNTAIVSPTGTSAGVGFAVPIDSIMASVDNVLSQATGDPKPHLGVSFVEADFAAQLQSQDLVSRGLFVLSIDPSSPAGRTNLAGLGSVRVGYNQWVPVLGDQIAAINDLPTRTVEEFRTVFDQFRPGDEIELTVYRNNQQRRISLTLDARKLWADEE